ncbi:MAG: hypothetical protein ACR9NN_18860 [Nostochopsis sp.]
MCKVSIGLLLTYVKFIDIFFIYFLLSKIIGNEIINNYEKSDGATKGLVHRAEVQKQRAKGNKAYAAYFLDVLNWVVILAMMH